MKTRRSLLLKNLETSEVLLCVLSAVMEASQGLRAAQREGISPLGDHGRLPGGCFAHNSKRLRSRDLSQEGCPLKVVSEEGVF